MTHDRNKRNESGGSATHFRMRPDLQVSPRRHRGVPFWVVHDPVAERFFLLRDEEYFVLRGLDGATDVPAIVVAFDERYVPRQLTVATCWSFVARLYQDGLVTSALPDVAGHLCARRRTIDRRQWLGRWGNPLFLRLPGFNPTRYFQRVDRFAKYIISPFGFVAALLLVAIALALLLTRWQEFSARWPEFHELAAHQNLWLYAIAFALLKILHECGHGMTCIRLGGHVRELGIRLMVGVPCLYCDVSESWMIPRRRDRIAIAAAGMIIEIVVAAIACLVWWCSTPGPVNSLARAVMLVGSVSTLFVNGNPLMRFDGYFILADMLDIPNLWGRSRTYWSHVFQSKILGIEVEDDRGEPFAHRYVLAIYGAASAGYQAMVVVGILWVLRGVLEMFRLDLFLPYLVLFVCGGMLIGPARQIVQICRHPTLRSQIRPGALGFRLAVAVVAIIAAISIPLPYRVTANAIIQNKDAHPLYVREAGIVFSAVEPGSVVKRGDIVATLQNEPLLRECAAARGARQKQKTEVERLDIQRIHEDETSVRSDRMLAKRHFEILDRRCHELETRMATLNLVAPRDGVVLSPLLRPTESKSDRLPQWSGSPLDLWNRNAWLEERTLFCTVGDPQQMEAWIQVDEADARSVAPGQSVKIFMAGIGGMSLVGTVREVSEAGTKVHSQETMGADTARENWLRDAKIQRPVQRFHQVRVTIQSDAHPVLAGMHGRAKIKVPGRSLFDRVFDYWRTNVRFAG